MLSLWSLDLLLQASAFVGSRVYDHIISTDFSIHRVQSFRGRGGLTHQSPGDHSYKSSDPLTVLYTALPDITSLSTFSVRFKADVAGED